MKNEQLHIIDHSTNVAVNAEEYNNECKTLEELANGLKALYVIIKDAESKYLNQFPKERGWRSSLEIDGVDRSFGVLLSSYFHWYANSLITYVRLVGYLESRYHGYLNETDFSDSPKKLKETCDDYMKNLSEIQAVLYWRNKVSAHLSITDARKDLPHIIRQSVLQPISFWLNHRFTACTIEGEIDDQHPNFPQWSVTLVHEALAHRFWPSPTELTNNIKGYNVRNNDWKSSGKYWFSAQIDQLIISHDGPPIFEDDYRLSMRNG